jgi:hypothetical protein
MRVSRWARAFLLLTILGAAPIEAAPFARHGIKVTDIYGGIRPKTITGPDGRTRAVARFTDWRRDGKDRFTVFLGGQDHDFPAGPNAELLWAPDSRAIAVTADDGGAAGTYEASVLIKGVKGRRWRWRRVDFSQRIATLFKPRMHCDDDEIPNVGAVGWTSGKRLIAVAQVPPHSSCANMGFVAGYIVDVPSGDVLMDIDLRTLRERYGRMLGSSLAPKRHRHRLRHH